MSSFNPFDERDGRSIPQWHGTEREVADLRAELSRLRKLVEATNNRRIAEQNVLLGALKSLRNAIPGFSVLTITDMEKVQTLIEEEIDPIIKSFEEPK